MTERIREAEVDVVLNLTAGMGGDIIFGPTEQPLPLSPQAPTWSARPSAWSTSPNACPRSARSIAAR